jgi:fibro-slime domain-containing protein
MVAMRSRSGSWLALLFAGCGLLACGGGRSSLHFTPDPCAQLGHERACTNTCGQGRQVCKDGAWQPCEVAVVSRNCSTVCGAGKETCRDNTWSTCAVAPVVQTCSTVCGSGKRVCQDAAWNDCDAPQPKLGIIRATIRDFHKTHPDFERRGSGDLSELGLVETVLGADETPTFAHDSGTVTVTGPETFADWYHDVPGVNVTIPYKIQLTPSPSKPGFYQYGSMNFFPLDDEPRGFGDEGQGHDFDFTLATKFNFHYLGGEVFRFTGDDDLWIFINRHLAIDLGGLHEVKTDEVYLDQHADELQITRGGTYELHLFFAERHVISSDFFIETTISDPGQCY